MAVDPPDTDQQPRVGAYSVSPFLKPEVSDQVRNRDPKKRVSWNWYDTWQEEHCRAFVVAKMCKADLLQEVHSSLQKAVDTGMTFAEWKKKVTPKLKGEWLGRTYGDIWENDLGNDIEDLPETQREKLISPRRLETIYRTNMKVAHAAGQYQSLKDMADLYPYWRYCTVGDDHVREAHRALNGMVFRHDDPFWDTHYPPNGWNCRCYVRAMDEDDLEEAGLKVTDSRDLQKIKFEGEQSGRGRIAYGIGEHVMDTDDGWNYNPGKVSAQVAEMAKKKMGKYEPPLKREVEKDVQDALEEQAQSNDKGREQAIQREPEEEKPDAEQHPNTVEPSAEVKSGTEKNEPAVRLVAGKPDAKQQAGEEKSVAKVELEAKQENKVIIQKADLPKWATDIYNNRTKILREAAKQHQDEIKATTKELIKKGLTGEKLADAVMNYIINFVPLETAEVGTIPEYVLTWMLNEPNIGIKGLKTMTDRTVFITNRVVLHGMQPTKINGGRGASVSDLSQLTKIIEQGKFLYDKNHENIIAFLPCKHLRNETAIDDLQKSIKLPIRFQGESTNHILTIGKVNHVNVREGKNRDTSQYIEIREKRPRDKS